MLNVFARVSVALVIGGALFGCGSSEDTENDTGEEGLEQGFTTCGELTCQPGQHCLNLICQAGCQSNVNCADDQTCEDIDDNSHVGTCRSGEKAPPEKDCATFCAKAEACNAPNLDQCPQICEAASSECVACMNDSNCGAGCESVCGG